MALGLLGRKVGMTQIFLQEGKVEPVTVIQAGPCKALQIRTKDRDGYDAVQLGFLDKPRGKAKRTERGQVARLDSKRMRKLQQAGVEPPPKADCEPQRFIREFAGAVDGVEVGQEFNVELFGDVAAVDVTGVSKGRGFAGAMKRHNFRGQRASHGVKKVHRHMGGTSAATYPARTIRGKKMPGRYGGKSSTVRNLKVVKVDAENHLILVRGATPGPNGGLLVIRPTNKVGVRWFGARLRVEL